MDSMNKLINDIDNYYSKKITKFGITPKGVDWNNVETQDVRFQQLLKVVNMKTHFSINDLGCGYGSIISFLTKNDFSNFSYYGYDFSEQMISAANEQYPQNKDYNFFKINSEKELKKADYTIASGIFNVKMHYKEHEWLAYILKTIEAMSKFSTKGFAFNILTKYSDKEYMRNDLYYADPLFFFDYCKRNFSRNVAILHDYELYEFTILIRK